MSTLAADGDSNVPIYLGLGVVVIILIAFFSRDSKDGAGGKKSRSAVAAAAAPSSSSSSKKSKKKKASKSGGGNKAPAAEKKVAFKEEKEGAAPPQAPEVVQTEAAPSKKKKKKKSKKKGGASTAPAAEEKAPAAAPPAASDDSDEESDDEELWRIQSESKRRGANDAAKRAAANKVRDRARALERAEKRDRALAKARAEAEEAARVEREAEEAVARMMAEAEAKTAGTAAKSAAAGAKGGKSSGKENGGANGSGNGEDASATAAAAAGAPAGEKKKRKRKKKKSGASGTGADAAPGARDPLVKPAQPSVEHWETVPKVEEWQEVGHKKSKAKAKVSEGADSPAPFEETTAEAAEAGETSATVTIPAGYDPLIFIGKGGTIIAKLQNETGAKFHLNRQTNVLTITGPEDCVNLGVAEANSILAAEEQRKADEAEERVTWGSDAIKAVIGRGGMNIRAAQEHTGVRIDADVEAGTLVIVGPRSMVALALTMCHNFAFGEVQEVLELGSRNAVNLVYGPGFRTIRSLQDATGCKLDIARGSTTLKLAGSAESVQEATAKIRVLLEANRGFEMTIENSKVGAVYGKGGETLRSIQDRTGTQIDVSRGPTHATVSVMGTAESSARARNMLQRAIDGEVELQPGEVAEEIELGSATAAVIGRGGSNVAELEKRHGVKINVRSELQKARVVGKPDKVAGAVKDIAAIAKPIIDAEEAQKKADEALNTGESAWQVETSDDAEGW